MQKSNEDCYYFLTSSCTKGSGCTYRHNSGVLTCNVICPAWLRGNCIDPACPLRHSAVQRSTINNGITCFYENTPMGCLKLDCTFVHLRPRPTLRNPSTFRPSTTNLVNKDAIKSTTITNSPSTPSNNIPQITNDSIPSPEINSSQTSTPKIEIPLTSTEISSSTISNETIPRRIAVPIENEQIETTNRNVITDSTEKNQEDTKPTTTTTQSRIVGNRNVVIAETANTSNRKIVQGTTNRVVVSSDTINSSKRITNDNDSDSDLDDLVKQLKNDIKKTNSVIDISFPCSAPSITNRLFMSTKQTTPTNDTKPIRLNRDRLPAAKITISNSSNSLSASSNGEKTSAGTELSQDGERRTSRIERFKKKSISSPRSVVNTPSSSSIPTRNIVTPSSNERKRPGPESSINDSPPSKRVSSQQENNHYHNATATTTTTTTIGDLCSPTSNSRRTRDHHHHRHRSSSSSSSSSQRKSSPRKTYSLKSSMDDSTWKKEVDEFLAKTKPKIPLPSPIMPCQPVPLLSLRPRYIPPPPPPPPSQQQQKPMIPRHPPPSQRPRQPSSSSVANKQPVQPVVNNSSPVPSKPPEQIPSSNNNKPPIQSLTISNDEDENRLLELDEPTDVVDTFALIDEALFEADHLLELM
ncbi:unnamed protein product [Rotaria sordida]|uniref:C3H1-type domain-containing protein n=1 Tax=Rotaria sordida TaxID=392033 RepID=A0A814QU94_9BILA|nr:unnamed protein product [Rotaria sordida]